MDKALNYLALAKRGRLVELGEEPVGAITRTGKGYLVVVAKDASDHTWRRAKSFVAGTDQQCISVPFTKEELGFVVGRTSLAIAAFTDVALALAFVQALEEPEHYSQLVLTLESQVERVKKRRAEEKAHQKNVRQGKRKQTKP